MSGTALLPRLQRNLPSRFEVTREFRAGIVPFHGDLNRARRRERSKGFPPGGRAVGVGVCFDKHRAARKEIRRLGTHRPRREERIAPTRSLVEPRDPGQVEPNSTTGGIPVDIQACTRGAHVQQLHAGVAQPKLPS